jgi:hypothetical protein
MVKNLANLKNLGSRQSFQKKFTIFAIQKKQTQIK